MGGRSGGGGGATPKEPKRGGLTGDVGGNIKVTAVESLIHMKDPAMYKAVSKAISRYESVLGVRQKDIKLANMPAGIMGLHKTMNGQSEGVYLNSAYFKGKNAAKIHEAGMKKQYAEHWQTKTNQPLAHVITHELGHATWNNHLTTPNAKAATKEVTKLYNTWLKDTKHRKNYGDYAKTNINEFWAETCTKAVHGNADHYTRTAKSIIRRYKL